MKKVREASRGHGSEAMTRWTSAVMATSLALWSLEGHAEPNVTEAAPASPGSAPAKAEESDAAQTELLERALSPDPTGLTADEVVDKALKRSPVLHKSRTQTSKAEANAARAKLAFVPRLDLSARYTRLSEVDLPPLEFGGGPPQENPFPQYLNQYNATASVRVPITDLFLTILPSYESATLASGVARAEQDARRLSAAYDARIAFYTYLRARGAAVIREDSVRVLSAHVADLTALAAAGAATQTDRVRAEARLSQAKLALAQTEGAVQVSLVRLSRAVGEQIDPSRPIGERLLDPLTGVPEAGDALTEAFKSRPELRALRALVKVREKQESARWGAQLPSLSATGNYYSIKPNPRVFPAQDRFDETWDVGLALAWSPNDYVQARLQTSDAELETDMVHDDMHLLEDSIAVEVASAVVDARLAIERIQANEQTAKAAARRYADQRALMMAGAATPSDVLEAEQEMRQAQLEWVDAYIQAKMARATLLKARGYVTTQEAPIAQGNAP